MKKTIALSLILAFVLTGCSLNFGKSKKTEDQKAENKNAGMVEEETTLIGWLKNGQGVECTVITLNGDVKVKAKEGKIKIEGIPYIYDQSTSTEVNSDQSNGTLLTVGDEQYLWSGQNGTKFNAKKLSEQSGGQTDEQMGAKSWEENIGEWESAGFNYKCEKRNFAEEEFIAPNGINFTDLNEALANLQKLNNIAPITGDLPSVDMERVDFVGEPDPSIEEPQPVY